MTSLLTERKKEVKTNLLLFLGSNSGQAKLEYFECVISKVGQNHQVNKEFLPSYLVTS
jgi:hypothetical protein